LQKIWKEIDLMVVTKPIQPETNTLEMLCAGTPTVQNVEDIQALPRASDKKPREEMLEMRPTNDTGLQVHARSKTQNHGARPYSRSHELSADVQQFQENPFNRWLNSILMNDFSRECTSQIAFEESCLGMTSRIEALQVQVGPNNR
jgi:hypothetical protein